MILATIFLASAAAQDRAAVARALSACGPDEVRFEVQTRATGPVAEPGADKALVYVIEVFNKASNELGEPTVRVGLDGAWVGATKGDSYSSFSVTAGEHHLCTEWQSQFKRLSRNVALANFAAEAGKTYYFRARITEQTNLAFTFDLDAVNEDEGKLLVASSAFSTHKPGNRRKNPKVP